jgi:hypothetical protein
MLMITIAFLAFDFWGWPHLGSLPEAFHEREELVPLQRLGAVRVHLVEHLTTSDDERPHRGINT